MKVTELPDEITQYFGKIKNWQTGIRDHVAELLLKRWKGFPFSEQEDQLDVQSSEVAAFWAINSKRLVSANYVQQIKKLGHIQISDQVGSGRRKIDFFRLGAIKDRKVRLKEEKHEVVTERQLYRRGGYSRLKQQPEKTEEAA